MADPSRSVIARVFHDAVHQPTNQRPAYLDRACAGDTAVRAKVEELLAALEMTDDFLAVPGCVQADRPVLPRAIDADATAEAEDSTHTVPGTRIGRYKLLQLIGEGGFGSVYMAEQEHPVRRRVALKIIKPGMDTKQVIARFEAERQALAMMDHPNIAKVLDAGETAAGRPYFVMELVKGIPITEYCDENKLDTVSRIRLFVDVCRAIQHAHQKAVIHRDVKPSNVLVAVSDDGRPLPKIIDFGIAKATQGKLTDKTLFTEFRQFIGTPEYMSPEQADAAAMDVDTRTDIYSLGVLLYELLTGSTPFDPTVLRSKPQEEIQRIIREVEPDKPSTRLGTLAGDRMKAVAGRRRVDGRKLSRLVRGDLDLIVMKCLEKDRTRRYETANAVAVDMHRFLLGEPVTARPPTPFYRVRKFGHRHRLGLVTGSAAGASLLLLAAAIMFGVFREARERGNHIIALQAEKQKALDEKRAALEALGETEEANAFLVKMFAAADSAARGADARGPARTTDPAVRAVLDAVVSELDRGSLAGRPRVGAAVRTALANAYREMGLYPEAEAQEQTARRLRRQVPPGPLAEPSPETAPSANNP